MDKPKFDKDIELAKVNLVAEEYRSYYQSRTTSYMTALVAILAIEITTFIGLDLSGHLVLGLAEFLPGVALVSIYFLPLFQRADENHKQNLRRLSTLITKVEHGEELGDLDKLVEVNKRAETASTSESPEFDKDTEILKATLLSDFRNGSFFAWTTIFLAIILGLQIMWWQYEASKMGLFSMEFYLGGALITGFFTILFVILFALPYLRHLKRMNELIKKIERKERLKDLIDLMKGK
jgi:hypothetical protein